MSRLNIMLFRKSLFYAPLLIAAEGGHLAKHGFRPTLSLATPQRTVRASLLDGSIDVGQGAVSQSWALLEKGTAPGYVHFGQINCRDGFFLVGKPQSDFRWDRLAGARVLVDHGAQPLASFRYACYRQGVEFAALKSFDVGGEPEMLAAFVRGEADYVHLQGPAAQQAASGSAMIVASVGEAIGPMAFTSLMATRTWLEGPEAPRFIAAMVEAMRAMTESDPQALTALLAPHFPDSDARIVIEAIAAYQRLGTWAGPLAVPRNEYEVAQEAFLHAGGIRRRWDYEDVVVNLPVKLAA
jgi:NitT/TauT family transport system substrate-binding protein